MLAHAEIKTPLTSLIRQGRVKWAGNSNLKIYGTLRCASGKRMKKSHRVFFATETEAIANSYRPCGHCLRDKYKKWKESH